MHWLSCLLWGFSEFIGPELPIIPWENVMFPLQESQDKIMTKLF
jgi:hypothetical protein